MSPAGRSRMGSNVATAVDDWIAEPRAEARASTDTRPDSRPAKVRATFQLSADVLEWARDAVVALASTEQLTLAELVEQAISHELERLQQEHNHGERFPRRRRPLRPGRPIGS
jgi:hypothetical protein